MATFYENRHTPIVTAQKDRLGTAAHFHNHLEIVYLLEGATKVVCDDRQYTMNSGDVFVAFPNQVHFYPRIDDGYANHFLFIFSPFVCSEFKDLFQGMTPTEPIVRKKDQAPELLYLAEKIFESNKKELPYNNVITRGYLIAFLGILFRSMEFCEEKQSDGTLLRSILNYCNQNYTKQISLETLSVDLNVSKYHISHIFSQKLKTSFVDLVNGLRVNDAIQKLTSPQKIQITDIAYDCGFNSTRTFNRAFIKYTGMTPREYREENRNKTVSPIKFHIKG